MKKITLSILSTGLILGLIACSSQNGQGNIQSDVKSSEQGEKVVKKEDVREIVWQQLSSEQIEFIDGTWKDGKVSNYYAE